ncbi:hypothetical protein, partial [Neisseria perflava]|uniref:hypothetical protein n=1 Tax=Neisseria perflava TaxID=33053 RepID=UPI00209D95E8
HTKSRQTENRQIFVIPAQAGIQKPDISVMFSRYQKLKRLDSRLRGNDESSRILSAKRNTFLKFKKIFYLPIPNSRYYMFFQTAYAV